MESCFHDRFDRLQLEVTIVDSMNLKQLVEELTINFIEIFRNVEAIA